MSAIFGTYLIFNADNITTRGIFYKQETIEQKYKASDMNPILYKGEKAFEKFVTLDR